MPPAIAQDVVFEECVRITRVREAQGGVRRIRPVAEIPRLVAALRSASPRDWDIVIAYNPYALLASFLSGIEREVPLVYYSAELFDARRYWPQRLCERISRKSIDGLVVCQQDRGRLLQKRLDLNSPTLVVPNSCFDHYSTIQRQNQCVTHSHSKPIVFIYQGANHLDRRYLCELVNAFGNVDAEVLLRLALVGNLGNTTRLRKLTEDTRYPNHFEFVDSVPYPQHFAAAYRCDAGIMLYHRDISLNYRYCAPNKLYEYAMLGLPVLSSNQDHLKREIEGNGFGLCVDPEDSASLTEAVIQMTNTVKLQEMALRARQWYEKFGRYESAAAHLENWCTNLCSR